MMRIIALIKKTAFIRYLIFQIIVIIVFVLVLQRIHPQVIYKFVYENQSIHNDYNNQNFEHLMFGDNITGFPSLIVPNIVHYILFDITEITFVHYISILSVLKNQKPEVIYFHCNCGQLSGEYYLKVLEKSILAQTVIRVRKITKPTKIFGKPLSEDWQNWHSSDITRIQLLRDFGGIYIDTDVYVVKSLDVFRKFEMTLNWDDGLHLGSQVLLAHRNARFLRRWHDTYREYDPKLWYFNVGDLPTEAVLERNPELVHRLKGEFGVDGPRVCPKLYKMYYKNWRKEFFTIHLVIRNHTISAPDWCFELPQTNPDVMTFDEHNIKHLNITFAEMCRDVLN